MRSCLTNACTIALKWIIRNVLMDAAYLRRTGAVVFLNFYFCTFNGTST